jgi:hypothetical protein
VGTGAAGFRGLVSAFHDKSLGPETHAWDGCQQQAPWLGRSFLLSQTLAAPANTPTRERGQGLCPTPG